MPISVKIVIQVSNEELFVSRLNRFKVYLLALILYTAFISYMSLTPRPPGTDVGRETVPYFTYLSHLLMYLFLSIGIYLTSKEKIGHMSSLPMFSAVGSFIYGFMIEVFQFFIPGRSFSTLDLFFNGLGCLLFLILLNIFGKKLNI